MKNILTAIKNNKYLIIFFIILLFFLIFTNLHRTDDMSDEGLILEGSERLLSGQLIFKDFFSLIPPGLYYLLAGIWSIFGKTYLVARALNILIAWIICIFIYLTGRAILNKPLSILSVLVFAILFYPVQNILSFHWLALLFILMATWEINKYLKNEKNKNLSWSGFYLGVGMFFLHTQPTLVAFVIAMFILWHAKKNKPWLLTIKKLLYFTLSVAGTFLILMMPFFIQSGFQEIWHDLIISNFYYYPKINYFPLHNNLILYLLIINYLFLLFFLVKKKLFSSQILLYFLISLFMLSSSIYRLDRHHIAYIYHIFTLPLSLYVINDLENKLHGINKNIQKIYLPACFITPFFIAYLPWITVASNPNYWQATDTKIGPVYLSPLINRSIIAPVLQKLNTIPEDEIFIYPAHPHYYSLANKKNPTRYSIIFEDYLTEKAKIEIKNDLINKKIKYVLYPKGEWVNIKSKESFLVEFLQEYYDETKNKIR
jgi:4-amino-4-deoxy-L-arabinose transferase-like glycosyltransferase